MMDLQRIVLKNLPSKQYEDVESFFAFDRSNTGTGNLLAFILFYQSYSDFVREDRNLKLSYFNLYFKSYFSFIIVNAI
jgi:hypothetical protein